MQPLQGPLRKDASPHVGRFRWTKSVPSALPSVFIACCSSKGNESCQSRLRRRPCRLPQQERLPIPEAAPIAYQDEMTLQTDPGTDASGWSLTRTEDSLLYSFAGWEPVRYFRCP